MSKYEVRHEHSYLDMESKYRLFNKDGCELDLHDCCDVLNRKDIRIAELEKENYKNIENLAIISNYKAKVDRIEKERDEYKTFVIAHLPNISALAVHSKWAKIIEAKAKAILQAHNLEQQAKGISPAIELLFASGKINTTAYDIGMDYAEGLEQQAKQLREEVK